MASPGDVAKARLFLASAAGYCTSEIVDIDRGAHFDWGSPRALACVLKVIGPGSAIIAARSSAAALATPRMSLTSLLAPLLPWLSCLPLGLACWPPLRHEAASRPGCSREFLQNYVRLLAPLLVTSRRSCLPRAIE